MNQEIPNWWKVETRFLKYLFYYPKAERATDRMVLERFKEGKHPMDVPVVKANLKRRFFEARFYVYPALAFLVLYPLMPLIQLDAGIVVSLFILPVLMAMTVFGKNTPDLMGVAIYLLTLINTLLDPPHRLPQVLLMMPLFVMAWGRFRLLPERGTPGRLPRQIEGWMVLLTISEILVVNALQ